MRKQSNKTYFIIRMILIAGILPEDFFQIAKPIIKICYKTYRKICLMLFLAVTLQCN